MGKVSREQAVALGAALISNIDWSQLDANEAQAVIDGNGGEITKFVKNCGRMIIKVAKALWQSLTSVGKTGEEWITRLDGKGFRVGDHAKKLLRNAAFTTTTGTVYDLVVIKGEEFTTDADRTNENVRAEAKRRGYLTPPIEVAPLLRESITDKEIEEMGSYALIVMHEPVADVAGGLDLLGVSRYDGGRRLNAYIGYPQEQWFHGFGFVFLAPRTT